MTAVVQLLALLSGLSQAGAKQSAAPAYQIKGVVVDAISGAPVTRAEVSIFADTQEVKTTTGDDGQFVFQRVEAGKYPLYAAAPGYVKEGYNQHGAFLTAIAVGRGLDSEHIVFRLPPQAVIFGNVTNERGEAVRHAQVMLFGEGPGGEAQRILMQAQMQTNDLGEYRFAHLLAGSYHVAVQAQPWYAQTGFRYLPEPQAEQGISGIIVRFGPASQKPDPLLDVVYPITFYPGVTHQEEAGELAVAAGETEEADIPLQAVPAVHIRLTNLPVDEKNGIQIGANEKIFGSFNTFVNLQGAQITPGEYEVAGLPPGEVTLRINEIQGAGSNPRTIEANLSDGEQVDGAGTGATATITGRVTYPMEPSGAGQGGVTLINEENQSVSAQLQKDGTFSLAGVQEGTYRIFVNFPASGEYVERVAAEGAKTFGREIKIAGAADVRLNIAVEKGLGQVTGVAKLDGKPEAGVMILVEPESGENLEQDSRMDQSDSDGTFTLANVVPGKYVLMAIENGWGLHWMNPDAVKPYRTKAQPLTIAPNGAIKVIAEVQRKIK
jgi:Carboxypeptidase regulatory-like domain